MYTTNANTQLSFGIKNVDQSHFQLLLMILE